VARAGRSVARGATATSTSRGFDLLHLDCFSGIAGNMFLAALLDAGLSRRALREDLAGLGLDHKLVVRRVRRGAIAAPYLEVRAPTAKSGHRGRRFREIRALLRRAKLRAPVRERALAMFEALAEAEAKVHGVEVDRVHFHEVGAVDAIVDIAGAAIAIDRLGIRRITASPIALGHGSVETAHGRLPLPAPATLELLRGLPVVPANVEWETVTPTGAALARVLVDEFRELPPMTVGRIGHGAGNDRPGPMPNVLRAILGRDTATQRDRVCVLETHIDDLNPEHFEHAMERLFEAGALDVGLQTVQMKKNRTGFALRVIANPARAQELAAIVFAETSTAGIRVSHQERWVLRRSTRRIRTRFGAIRVKVLESESGVRFAAEYDDCKRAAKRAGAPLGEVVAAAEGAARAADDGEAGRVR
jgi:uncharacterized protein (TIGR00299 family) protein